MRPEFIGRAALASAILAMMPLAMAQPAAFDVVSIRPNDTGEQNYSIRTPPGGRFTGRNITVRALLLYALNIKGFQIVNLPGWCDSERFDIEAKTNIQDAIDPEGLRPLIGKLLELRFQLAVHRETKEFALYSLTAPKGAAKLHSNSGTPGHSSDWGRDHVNATAVSVAEFSHLLEAELDRVVVDHTGIQGAFDFHLTWVPDQQVDTSGPSLFTAIQEQYGLKLESAKGPVAITVVDHVERPSEN
jgi:uncharacterized protein (TIGR03435 family)